MGQAEPEITIEARYDFRNLDVYVTGDLIQCFSFVQKPDTV